MEFDFWINYTKANNTEILLYLSPLFLSEWIPNQDN